MWTEAYEDAEIEDRVSLRDTLYYIRDLLRPDDMDILYMLYVGYTQKEIGGMRQVSQQAISQRVKTMRVLILNAIGPEAVTLWRHVPSTVVLPVARK